MLDSAVIVMPIASEQLAYGNGVNKFGDLLSPSPRCYSLLLRNPLITGRAIDGK